MERRNRSKLGGGRGEVIMLGCVCVDYSTLASTHVSVITF